MSRSVLREVSLEGAQKRKGESPSADAGVKKRLGTGSTKAVQ